MSVAYWVCAAVTVVSSVVSAGYAVAGLRAATGATRVPSLYALARSVALVAVAAASLFAGSIGFLAAAAIAMIVVQALDAVVGATIKDRVKTFGPAATAAFNLAALVWLLVS